jgi:hypothetical protein
MPVWVREMQETIILFHLGHCFLIKEEFILNLIESESLGRWIGECG